MSARSRETRDSITAEWWNDRQLNREEKEAMLRSWEAKNELSFNKRQRID